MNRVFEIDITPEIPASEWIKAMAWCVRFKRSWQEAKQHRQERAQVYRRNVIEPLEQRRLLSVSGVTITGLGDTGGGGSNGPTPNAIEGQGISANFTYGTDHDNVDSGHAHVTVANGDGSSDTYDVNSGTTSFGHTYPDAGIYTLDVFVWDDQGYNTYNNTTWNAGSAETTATIVVADAPLDSQGSNDFTVNEGETYEGMMGSFVDEGGAKMQDYSGTIDWGDGTTSSADFAGSDGVVYVGGAHNYAVGSDYPVHIDVYDQGGAGTTFNLTAKVKHTAPYMVLSDSADGSNPRPIGEIYNLPILSGKHEFYICTYNADDSAAAVPAPTIGETSTSRAKARYDAPSQVSPNIYKLTVWYDKDSWGLDQTDMYALNIDQPGFTRVTLTIQFKAGNTH